MASSPINGSVSSGSTAQPISIFANDKNKVSNLFKKSVSADPIENAKTAEENKAWYNKQKARITCGVCAGVVAYSVAASVAVIAMAALATTPPGAFFIACIVVSVACTILNIGSYGQCGIKAYHAINSQEKHVENFNRSDLPPLKTTDSKNKLTSNLLQEQFNKYYDVEEKGPSSSAPSLAPDGRPKIPWYKEKPVALLIRAKADWNGAVNRQTMFKRKEQVELAKYYNVIVVEAGSKKDIQDAIVFANLKSKRRVKYLEITAHGYSKGMSLSGENEINANDRDLQKTFSNLEKDAQIVLKSCSTAKESRDKSLNVAQAISNASGCKIHASSSIAADFTVELEFFGRGKFKKAKFSHFYLYNLRQTEREYSPKKTSGT